VAGSEKKADIGATPYASVEDDLVTQKLDCSCANIVTSSTLDRSMMIGNDTNHNPEPIQIPDATFAVTSIQPREADPTSNPRALMTVVVQAVVKLG
jgi:hypothetical protein